MEKKGGVMYPLVTAKEEEQGRRGGGAKRSPKGRGGEKGEKNYHSPLQHLVSSK